LKKYLVEQKPSLAQLALEVLQRKVYLLIKKVEKKYRTKTFSLAGTFTPAASINGRHASASRDRSMEAWERRWLPFCLDKV